MKWFYLSGGILGILLIVATFLFADSTAMYAKVIPGGIVTIACFRWAYSEHKKQKTTGVNNGNN